VAGGLDPIIGPSAQRTASSCLCIISDDTIAGASSQITGINLSESCGQSQCFKDNPTPGNGLPDRLEIPCDSPENFNPFTNLLEELEKEAAEANFKRWVIIALVVIGVIVVILVMLYLSGIGIDTGRKIITRKPAPLEPPLDMELALQQERYRLYGDSVGGTILDRGTNPFPLFPQAPIPEEMSGSLLNSQFSSSKIAPPPAPGGCHSEISILGRDISACPQTDLSSSCPATRSILDRGLHPS
jgi:hypothetical protein